VQKARIDPAVWLVVLDAAIMMEAGWDRLCDRLVFVEAPREERLRRVAPQRGWSAEELALREAAQLPLTEKRCRADHVLDNSASLDDLERQVDDLLARWGLATPGLPALGSPRNCRSAILDPEGTLPL
jgi:dephospho-CoA kinase